MLLLEAGPPNAPPHILEPGPERPQLDLGDKAERVRQHKGEHL